MPTKKLKAFTLAELLVTLALTAILVTLAYSGLNYIQKLLKQYNEQSFFITQLTELNKRIHYQMGIAREIETRDEKNLYFYSDSGSVNLALNPEVIVLEKNQQADSFKVKCSDIKVVYEPLGISDKQLVTTLEFDLDFRKQKFHCTFHKNYDAYSKFIIETSHGND